MLSREKRIWFEWLGGRMPAWWCEKERTVAAYAYCQEVLLGRQATLRDIQAGFFPGIPLLLANRNRYTTPFSPIPIPLGFTRIVRETHFLTSTPSLSRATQEKYFPFGRYQRQSRINCFQMSSQ